MDTSDIEKLLKSRCCTVEHASEVLGVSAARVRQLIAENKLPAAKWGKEHIIVLADLSRFAKIPRKIGRPKVNAN